MTSLPHSGQKPPLLLEYRPVVPGSYAMADRQPPTVPEPDWNDPLEVQAFSLMREGRTDEALALLQSELGRARTRATGEGPLSPGAPPRSWNIAAPVLKAADLRAPTRTAEGGLDKPVAHHGRSGLSASGPARFGPAWAASRRPAMWAIGTASVTLAVLAGMLWPTTDLGVTDATGGLGTLALESRPAALPQAPTEKLATGRPVAEAPVQSASLAVAATPAATAPVTQATALAAPAAAALSASPDLLGEKAAGGDSSSAPAGLATLQPPSSAAAPSVPFTPKPRPGTPSSLDAPPVGDVASAQVQAKSAVKRQVRNPAVAATPRARNRAAALAYAQKRRVAAERAAGRRQVPLIGDGTGQARSGAARYDRDGPVILLGGHGLP